MEQAVNHFHDTEPMRLEPITAAKLLICNEIDGQDHMLLLKCAAYGDRPMRIGDDAWDLPGGKVDDKESSQDAAIREAQEELGDGMAATLSIDGLRLVKAITRPKFSAGLSITRVYYTARTSRLEFVTGKEHKGGFWCPLANILQHVTRPLNFMTMLLPEIQRSPFLTGLLIATTYFINTRCCSKELTATP